MKWVWESAAVGLEQESRSRGCAGARRAPPAPLCPIEDLGMKHRLWVYSGRRGVHCWVCDDAVRKWSPALRAAAVEYLSLVKVGVWGMEGGGLCCPPAWAEHAVLPRVELRR